MAVLLDDDCGGKDEDHGSLMDGREVGEIEGLAGLDLAGHLGGGGLELIDGLGRGDLGLSSGDLGGLSGGGGGHAFGHFGAGGQGEAEGGHGDE